MSLAGGSNSVMANDIGQSVSSVDAAPVRPAAVFDSRKFVNDCMVDKAVLQHAASDNDLTRMFVEKTGATAYKWHHYLDIYHRHLSRFRGTKVRFLEIGVFQGGSLDIWREFLGPEATIFGIDIDPACGRFNDVSGQVRIGSQDDPAFLAEVITEMGGVDVVLDDGSHMSPHMRASLQHLFPALNDGGCYLIEDTHATYWPDYSGGYDTTTSFLTDVKDLIDDMHHWYHSKDFKNPATNASVGGIHIYDSVVVLDKTQSKKPQTSLFGNGA